MFILKELINNLTRQITEVDSGVLRDNLEMADTYRGKTLRFAKISLGLADDSDAMPVLHDEYITDRIIKSFEVVGRTIREVYSTGMYLIYVGNLRYLNSRFY